MYNATDSIVGKVKQTGESQKTCFMLIIRPYRDMRHGKDELLIKVSVMLAAGGFLIQLGWSIASAASILSPRKYALYRLGRMVVVGLKVKLNIEFVYYYIGLENGGLS